MRNHLLTLVFILLCKIIVSQNAWCPQGATWYYGSYCFGLNPAKQKVSYLQDSVFNTINCKYVKSELICAPPQNGTYTSYYFTYENNNVVYLYNANGSFDTLFNFNANIGDSWLRYIALNGVVGDTNSFNFNRSKVTVLDTGSTFVNGYNLKKIVIEYNAIYRVSPDTIQYTIIDTVYEKLGSVIHGWHPIIPETYYGVTDIGDASSFRCYEDNVFGLYHKSGTLACDSLQGVGLNRIDVDNSFVIYPNPTSTLLNIVLPNSINTFGNTKSVIVYNALGEIVLKQNINASSFNLNVSEFEKGIYLVTIVDQYIVQFSKKFLKE